MGLPESPNPVPWGNPGGKIVAFFRKIYLFFVRASWVLFLLVLGVLFFGGWYFTWLFEAPREIASPGAYWWYFIVTGTTVGYGDFFPVTLGGRITSLFIMFGMLGFMAGIIGKVADTIFNLSRWRVRGMFNLHLENHIVVFGYRSGETETLIQEIQGDVLAKKMPIVLCSSSARENPIRGIEFVHGKLSSQDVLERSCVAKASRVIIHGATDDQTLAVGIAVNHVTGAKTHIAAFFLDPSSVEYLQKVNPQIECVHSLAVPMLVQAMQDPGSTQVIRKITSNLEQGTQYRLNIPENTASSWRFGELLGLFKERFDGILIGVADSHDFGAEVIINPDTGRIISGGMSLFYISGRRIDQNIDWNRLDTA